MYQVLRVGCCVCVTVCWLYVSGAACGVVYVCNCVLVVCIRCCVWGVVCVTVCWLYVSGAACWVLCV